MPIGPSTAAPATPATAKVSSATPSTANAASSKASAIVSTVNRIAFTVPTGLWWVAIRPAAWWPPSRRTLPATHSSAPAGMAADPRQHPVAPKQVTGEGSQRHQAQEADDRDPRVEALLREGGYEPVEPAVQLSVEWGVGVERRWLGEGDEAGGEPIPDGRHDEGGRAHVGNQVGRRGRDRGQGCPRGRGPRIEVVGGRGHDCLLAPEHPLR